MLLIARYEGTYKQLPIRKVLNTPSRVLGTVGVAVPYCKAATSADSAGGAHEAISIHERDDAWMTRVPTIPRSHPHPPRHPPRCEPGKLEVQLCRDVQCRDREDTTGKSRSPGYILCVV